MISMWDVDTIYKVPRMLHEQGLDGLICDKLRLNTPPANLKRWDDLVYETEHPQGEVNIAMVGKYVDLSDSYKSLNEALRHAGMKNHVRVKIDYVDSETITPDSVTQLAREVRRGAGARRLRQARHRRQDRGGPLCPREQGALPGHLPGHAGRHHRVRAPRRRPRRTPTAPSSSRTRPNPVIALITEWKDADGTIKTRDENSDLGGTMRLGAQSSDVAQGRWRTRSTATW